MSTPPVLRLALPKGRTEVGVRTLLAEAGLGLRGSPRAYRPTLSVPGFEAKLLKPRNVVDMLALGSRDLGFAGADWVAESDAELVELLDTGLDPVRIVAACPPELLVDGVLPARPLRIASEYVGLTTRWAEARGLEAQVLRSAGATEVFPPEDADLIVDNTSTGATLNENGLTILEDVMSSSTRLYAYPGALEDPARRAAIERVLLLLRSVLASRSRVMLDVNVPAESLQDVVAVLPCMREPTVAPLHGGAGYGVKAAVPRDALPELIPLIKARGGDDIVVSSAAQIVP